MVPYIPFGALGAPSYLIAMFPFFVTIVSANLASAQFWSISCIDECSKATATDLGEENAVAAQVMETSMRAVDTYDIYWAPPFIAKAGIVDVHGIANALAIHANATAANTIAIHANVTASILSSSEFRLRKLKPREPQESPREPKRAPREPKTAPRAAQESPREPQESPKDPQENPRTQDEHLGTVLGSLGTVWGSLGPLLGSLGALVGSLGAALGSKSNEKQFVF